MRTSPVVVMYDVTAIAMATVATATVAIGSCVCARHRGYRIHGYCDCARVLHVYIDAGYSLSDVRGDRV